MAYQKVVIEKCEKLSGRKFKAKKQKDNEEDIFVEFSSDVDYVVEKLSTDGLPSKTDDNKDIKWLNNFSVKDNKGNYVNGVTYFVLMPAIAGYDKIVYFDGAAVRYYEGAVENTTENKKKMKRIKLNIGDPATGWVKS